VLELNYLESQGYIRDIGELDDWTPTIQIVDNFSFSTWYCDIVSYLLTLQCPNEMTPSKVRNLKLHTVKYCIIDGQTILEGSSRFLVNFLNRI
jgi:hypothetical protein